MADERRPFGGGQAPGDEASGGDGISPRGTGAVGDAGAVGDEASGGDGAPGDPVEAELRALFAVALTGEPPSAVTPLSVLHRAHLDRSARRERRVGRIRRWGGAVVAAAAVVAAVVLLGPVLGNRSGSSGTAAGSGAVVSAVAGDHAGPAAEGTVTSGSSAAAATSAAGSEPNAAAPNAASTSAAQTRAAGPSRATPDEAGAPAGAPDVTGGGAVGTTAAAGGASGACELPPLLPAERAAAIDALPTGTIAGVARVPCPASGGQVGQASERGTVLRTTWPSGTVTVVVGPALTGPATSGTSSGELPGAGGSVGVWVERAGVEVRVAADRAAAAHLTPEALHAVATAVRGATR